MCPEGKTVGHHRATSRLLCAGALTLLFMGSSVGCLNSFLNGWLDPTVVGNFADTSMLDIRNSLTLEDAPSAIPGALPPTRDDLRVTPVEFPIAPGDTLTIEIYELRQRDIPYQAQTAVSSTGYVNIPVLGRIDAMGLTAPGLEDAIANELRDRDILVSPEVTVTPIFLQVATYSIFGVGASAANNAPLRAGTFPIRRPDLKVLEAVNQVGGLNDFVTDIYVFRYDEPPWLDMRRKPSAAPSVPGSGQDTETPPDAESGRQGQQDDGADDEPGNDDRAQATAAERELVEAVILGDEPETIPREKDTPDQAALEELAPEPTDPYLFVDGEFVPNPAYDQEEAGAMPVGPLQDMVTAVVDWARIAGDRSYRVIRIPAEPLRSGDPGVNVVVRAGDVIRIVSGEIGVYYVMGQVNTVGPFAFGAQKVTLKSAIAAAGGLSGLAWPDRCTIYRRIGQREQMIQVNLDRVFAGKDPDFFVKRDDIINVGTHPLAPFVQAVRGFTIPNPTTNVGYSFTYARNFADIDSFIAQRNPDTQPSLSELGLQALTP